MKNIITISREFGAAGSEVGQKIAHNLGFHYYDKEIIVKAAQEMNEDKNALLEFDETAPELFGFTQKLFDFYDAPLNGRLFDAQKSVIKKIAEKGNCVIVGRNSNSILKEYENSLHVFLSADLYWRISYLKQRKMPESSEGRIIEDIRTIDKKRRKYCAYYTNTEFGVADYYDICLSVSSLGVDSCVDLICSLARKENE